MLTLRPVWIECVCIGLLQMRLWVCLDTACEVFRGEFGRHPVVEIGLWINAESVMMWSPCISSCSPQHSVLCGASPLGWHPAVFAFDNFTVGLKVHLRSKRDTPRMREGSGKGKAGRKRGDTGKEMTRDSEKESNTMESEEKGKARQQSIHMVA